MEILPFGHKEVEEEDRLSALPDDILLDILERMPLHSTMQTTILSRRWRHLPLMLSRLVFQVDEFSEYSEITTIHQVMASYCEATRKLLASASAVKDIRLIFYLADPCHLLSLGQAVGTAVQSRNIEVLEFNIRPENRRTGCTMENMKLFGRRFMSFLDARPDAFRSLTSLTLRGLLFGEADMQTILNTCGNLKALSLHSCVQSRNFVLKMDAPGSHLVALEFTACYFSQVMLICLPQLARLVYETWLCIKSPLFFGNVPRLHSIKVACALLSWQMPFTLSGWCLSNTTSSLTTLFLDFRDEMVWFQPEDPKRLVPAFSSLKVVHLYDIFSDCDLKWTLLFLEAAPSLHSFYVKISRHICRRYKLSCDETAQTTNLLWEPSDFKHCSLNLLDIEGFQNEEKLISYIKLVMERAVALRKIHLHY
jgi:hypothetical protein